MLIPWVSWRDELPLSLDRSSPPPDVEWVPGPNRNKKLVFTVLFAAPESPSIDTVSLRGDRYVATALPTSTGESVWLSIRHAEMSPEDNRALRTMEREFRGFRVAAEKQDVAAWGMSVSSHTEQPVLTQFPLGRRHVTLDPPT